MADELDDLIVVSVEEMDVLWERASPEGFLRRDRLRPAKRENDPGAAPRGRST